MGLKRKGKKRGVLIWVLVLLFLGVEIPVSTAKENKISSETVSPKEAVMEEALHAIKDKEIPATTTKEKTPANAPMTSKQQSEKQKIEENEKMKEKELLLMVSDVLWNLSDQKIVMEILGSEKGEIPSGDIFSEQEGLMLRWRPRRRVLLQKKKKNDLNSSWISEIFFQEDAAKTKALGVSAPFYVLDSMEIHFTELVSYRVTRTKKSLRLEFQPLRKRKPVTSKEEPSETKGVVSAEPLPSSPNDILGTVYQAKTEYENYVIGESRAAEALRNLQPRGGKGIFNGTLGFPKDIGPVFEEAYPPFGSFEYWKKYVRAVFDQTTGFSSDYDGTYGAWGGIRAHNPAMTWTPDLAVRYVRPGTISPSLGYQINRVCPVSRLMHFADGRENQTISFGAGYSPGKPYSFFSENSLYLFKSKTLTQQAEAGIARQANHGIRMTNALGLNYRLTRRLLWKLSGGLEGTRSETAGSGQTRTNIGFLSSGFGYSFSKKISGGLSYTYRHMFKDTGAPEGATTGWVMNAKGKNLQVGSVGLKYQPFKQLVLSGALTPAVIDGQYYKFGGVTSLKYQHSPVDDLSFIYSSGVVQDDTSQLTGTGLGGVRSSGGISLFRNERTSLEYNYRFMKHRAPKMNLKLSLTYQRSMPLVGLSSDAGTLSQGLRFEASLRRKLRGGKLWLGITYRYSNYYQKGLGWGDTLDSSVQENSIFLSITNSFGT